MNEQFYFILFKHNFEMNTSSQSIKLKKKLYFTPQKVQINLNQCCAFQQVHEWKIIRKQPTSKSKQYLKLSIHHNQPFQKTLPNVQSKQTHIQSKQTQYQSKQQLQSADCLSRQSSQSGFEQVKMEFFSQLKSFNGSNISPMSSIQMEQISPIYKEKQFGFMNLEKEVEQWQIQQHGRCKEFPQEEDQQGELSRFSKYEIRRWGELDRISEVSRMYETTDGISTLKSSLIFHSQFHY